jgi:hypothetical protein
MINNKWTHGKTHFVLPPLPPELRCSEGILPWRLALDPKAGSEMVLLLLDRTPFIHDLAKVRPFDLRLKTGLVRTSHGPLCFLLFYIPDPRHPGAVFLAIDAHLNPFEAQHVLAWRDLARQSYWHLILVGADDKLVDLFEFPNTFELDLTLDTLESVSPSMAGGNFNMAKSEFEATYTIDDLLRM